MSTFERAGFHWRETYFVYFHAARRPSMKRIEKLLHGISQRFEMVDSCADEEGRFESLTVLAPDDYAALDVSLISGEEVVEQAGSLAKELRGGVAREERERLAELARCDARFDLLHFEQLVPVAAGEEPDEMLDPSALLMVLDALVELTGGIGIDPQSGALM